MTFTRNAGLLKGIVVDTNDPAGLNRVKIRIPQLHGFVNESSYGPISITTIRNSRVADTGLPWASVCYPFGSTTNPEINQVVWVSFVNGDSNYPVIIGWAGYEYTSEEEILTVQ